MADEFESLEMNLDQFTLPSWRIKLLVRILCVRRLFSCKENDTRSGRRFARRLYPFHSPLRFITSYSCFALASAMRKKKRLRRSLEQYPH